MSTTESKPKAPAYVLGAGPVQFTWTVRIPVPGNDDYTHAELPLIFETVEQPELDKMQGRGLAEGEQPPSDVQIIERVVKGWPELKTASGEPVPFSPEALAALTQGAMVRSAIVGTYLLAMSGMAARKNA